MIESTRTGFIGRWPVGQRLVAMALAMGMLALASPYILWLLHLTPVTCPFRILAGLACPGCGTTRSFFALGSGQVLTALRLNPLGFFLWLFLGATVVFKVGWLSRGAFDKAKRVLIAGGVSAALGVWLVMLVRRVSS